MKPICDNLRFTVLCLAAWLLYSAAPCPAGDLIQRLEIPSSPNPVGSGARALGMGGAFIAMADDATAASWNPSGLIQLERPEISVVGAAFHRIEENRFGIYAPADGEETVSLASLNYLSAAYPFNFGGYNMVVSLNYQKRFDFTRKWSFPLPQKSQTLFLDQKVDYQQEGGLYAYSLAYCLQLTPRFSMGFGLNFWEDGIEENEWTQKTHQWGSGTSYGKEVAFHYQNIDRYGFSGFNLNFGLLWEIQRGFRIGAVFKTPFDADLRHESRYSAAIGYPNLPGPNADPWVETTSNETLEMPMSYGIGLAWRPDNELTMTLDLYRTHWEDFVLADKDGVRRSPVTGKAVSLSRIDPSHQVRAGIEYLFKFERHIVPVRGGLFYDPAPSENAPDDIFGFSLGTGIATRRLAFDLAYQYRFGEEIGGSVLNAWDFSQDLREHTVYSALIVYF